MHRPAGVIVVWRNNYNHYYNGAAADKAWVIDLVFTVNAMMAEGSVLSYKLVEEKGSWHVMEMRRRRGYTRWTGYYLSMRDTLYALDRSARAEKAAEIRAGLLSPF